MAVGQISKLLPMLIILILCIVKCTFSQRGIKYPLTFQPEMDSLNIVGRWLKPRLIPGLFGACPACSPYQKQALPDNLILFADLYPDMFRAVVAQWLIDQGYDVNIQEEAPKIKEAMGFGVDYSKIINPQNVINASYDEALNATQLKQQKSIFGYIGRTRGGIGIY